MSRERTLAAPDIDDATTTAGRVATESPPPPTPRHDALGACWVRTSTHMSADAGRTTPLGDLVIGGSRHPVRRRVRVPGGSATATRWFADASAVGRPHATRGSGCLESTGRRGEGPGGVGGNVAGPPRGDEGGDLGWNAATHAPAQLREPFGRPASQTAERESSRRQARATQFGSRDPPCSGERRTGRRAHPHLGGPSPKEGVGREGRP